MNLNRETEGKIQKKAFLISEDTVYVFISDKRSNELHKRQVRCFFPLVAYKDKIKKA